MLQEKVRNHWASIFFFALVGFLFSGGNDLAASSKLGFLTNDAPYLKVVQPGTVITPLLTVGESVPRTSNPKQLFRLVGKPDGMGIYRDKQERIHLLVNHELKQNTASQPLVDQPLQEGAFVSELILSNEGRILSGDVVGTTVLDPKSGKPVTGIKSRLCSGFLAGPPQGFDRWIYLTGEEEKGKKTFDGLGGTAFAYLGDVAFALPHLGHYPKENLIVLPGSGLKTLIVGLEDAPESMESHLYLYIGTKNLSSDDPLQRNGLVGGQLYVFASKTEGRSDETTFCKRNPPVVGHWLPVSHAAQISDKDLNHQVTQKGVFHFDRMEDGTYDRKKSGIFYFVTSGGNSSANRRGRLYRLTLDPKNPLNQPTLLEVLLEGDAGDPIISPDNLDANENGELMIEEDFTLLGSLLSKGRHPSIWLYSPKKQELTRLAEVTHHSHETSGIIDTASFFGPGTWLTTVQAHSISSRKASKLQNIPGDAYLVEGGQILLLKQP